MATINFSASPAITRAASFAAYSIALIITRDASFATGLNNEDKG